VHAWQQQQQLYLAHPATGAGTLSHPRIWLAGMESAAAAGLQTLPHTLMQHILNHLSPAQALRLSLVSREMAAAVRASAYWQEACLKAGWL
jgi:hypothetical protein